MQLHVIRNIVLLDCAVVIVLCGIFWPFHLFLEALPGALVLAVIHPLLFFVHCKRGIKLPSGKRVFWVLFTLALLQLRFTYSACFQGAEPNEPTKFVTQHVDRSSYLPNFPFGYTCRLPANAQPATVLALLDAVDAISVAVLAVVFHSVARLFECHTNIIVVATVWAFPCSLGWATFNHWFQTFHSFNPQPTTLLPQTDTIYGLSTLVAMITTAVLLVAIADGVARAPNEKWQSFWWKYALIMTASALDLSTTACAFAFWKIAQAVVLSTPTPHTTTPTAKDDNKPAKTD